MLKRHLDSALKNVLYLFISSEVVSQLDYTTDVGPFQLKYAILCFLLLSLAVYAEKILDYISSQPCTSRRQLTPTTMSRHWLSHFLEGRRHGPSEGMRDVDHPEII